MFLGGSSPRLSLAIIKYKVFYNLRYFEIILLSKTAIQARPNSRRPPELHFRCFAGALHEDPRERVGLDGVDFHGCGLGTNVSAHLANALANDGVESVLDVIVRSV